MALGILTVFVLIAILGIPGMLLAFALLKGVKLNSADKAIIGLILGVLLNPFLSIIEFSLFRIPFSSALVLLNSLALLILAIILLFLQKQVHFNFSGLRRLASSEYYKELIERKPVAIGVYAVLLILMLAGFYARFATAWSTSFFEFDPYFYDKVTEEIVLHGSVPAKSDISYYPRFRSYRELPMIHYMTASWYALYKDFNSLQYDQQALILTIQFYPPLVAAFLIYLAFLFIREESNKYLGLVAAAMFAFTPQLIKKLGAGVSEQAPFGMFAAMLVFAMYALALNRKSYRLAVLASFSVVMALLGSAHHIWPFMILSGFVFILSIIEYYSGDFKARDFFLNLAVAGGALAANFIALLYREVPITLENSYVGVLFFVGVLFPSLVFFLAHKYGLEQRFSRRQILASVFLILLAFSLVTPLGLRSFSFINSLLRYAKADTPLNRTVQEENATSEGLFASSFGALNPNQLLIASTVLVVVLAVLALRRKGPAVAGGYAAGAFILVFFNKYIDLLFSAIGDLFSSAVPEVSLLFRFIVESDVFIYLIVSLISVLIYYHYEDKENRMVLLFLLAFFPTAYIGLSKVKYLLHLAFAVALALPFVLMMFSELMLRLNSAFRFTQDEQALKAYVLAFVMLIGTAAAYKQYETVPQSMAELQYSRMSSDWIDATRWMRASLGESDRVSSWWDYGHWTTFLGGAKTVLDPSNYYSDYDQLTARGYVHGNTSLLIDIMHYHQATHILVDSELVPKWGALVYLSGTFNGLSDDKRYNFLKQEIPSTSSPGSSEYESQHYFEYIYAVHTQAPDGSFSPTQCPGVIPKLMFYSSFGAAYCMDGKGNMFLLDQQGQSNVQLSDPRLVRADDSQLAPAPLGNNLFFNQRYAFINLNPGLSTLTDGRLKSSLVDSAFVQLFFFEKLEGFELVYKSPNAQVKIFKLLV